MAAQLKFAKFILNKPQDFWNNVVVGTEEPKVEITGHKAQHQI